MKLWFVFLFAAIFFTSFSFAQPGGGGGIRINIFLDKNNIPIPVGDTNLIIKTFLLSGEENPVITRQYTDAERDYSYRYTGRESTRYYVPPYLWGKNGKEPAPNQCLELIYKGDTAVVELLGISAGSPNGSAETMDTVTLWPGSYSRFYRTASKHFAIVRETERQKAVDKSSQAYELMCNGVTVSTYTGLYPFGLLQQRAPLIQVVYDRGNYYDTFPTFRMPLYTLPFSCISYKKDSSVWIRTSGIPLIQNKELLYRFVLDFIPKNINIFSGGNKEERDNEAKQYEQQMRFYNTLRRHTLFINNQPYTGTLKVFYAFRGIGIDWNATGYSLDVIQYKNGKLINIHSANDVDTDDERSHPRLTMR